MLESGLIEESRMKASGICHGDRRVSHPHSQAREHVLEVALCEDVKTNSNHFWKQESETITKLENRNPKDNGINILQAYSTFRFILSSCCNVIITAFYLTRNVFMVYACLL